MTPFCILHIPHSSVEIPPDYRGDIVLSDEELDREFLRTTDRYTDELFAPPDSRFMAVRHPISRLVLDPERFLDDSLEVMAAKGMGVIYTKTSDGAVLRNQPSEQERSALIDRYYEPHHKSLNDTADKALKQYGRCLIVDCHSFPAKPLPFEYYQSLDRPDICLGTDDTHTPGWLLGLAVDLFEKEGLKVEINRPFAGVLVSSNHYGKQPNVFALMIELNRALYMDESTGEKSNGFANTFRISQTVLNQLLEGCMRDGLRDRE
jgi:N-formylglutamate amidohydrolase